MINLMCVPLGCSLRLRFCAELENLPQGVLVLPNGLLLEDVRRQYNVTCLGMDTLANKILNLNGYVDFHQINRRSQELLVEAMIGDLQKIGRMEYFGELASKKGFVKAMTSLLGDLARSGAAQEEISSVLSEWDRPGNLGKKDSDIALLYQFYRNHLKNKNWFDLEGKYRLAILVLQEEAARLPWKQVYFSDFYSFDKLQLDFIKALSKRCQVTVGMCWEPKLAEADKDRERFFAASRTTYMELEGLCYAGGGRPQVQTYPDAWAGSAGCGQVRRNLGRRAQPLLPTGDVQAYCFSDREKEMRWALTQVKELLRSGVPADNIAVAVRDLSLYSGLRLVADEYGLPVALPQVSKLAAQPLTEMVLLLLEAAPDNREGAEAYFKLLAASRSLLQADGEAADRLRLANYFTSRRGAQEKARELAADDEVWRLLDAFLEALPPKATLKIYGEQVIAFLQELQLERRLGELYKKDIATLAEVGAVLQTREALAAAVRQLLDDYAACGRGEESIGLGQWRERLADALRQVNISLQGGRQDGVLVTEAVNLQGLEFDYVYLLGLREGEFPHVNNENWIYNDTERKELRDMGLDMPTTASSYAEDACFFGAAAASARQQLVLTFYKDDQAGASRYVEMVQKLFADADGGLLPVVSDPPKAAASPQELEQLGQGCDKEWLREALGEACVTAAQADERRADERRYNGVLQDADLLKKVRSGMGSSFSASMLEIYAQCPFRFLGERLWKQQEFVPMDDQLTPADEGDILHQTLARFLGKYLGVKLSEFPADALRLELAQDFADICRSAEEQGTVVGGLLWQAERPRLEKLLQQWLDFELADQRRWADFTPCAVEWDFSSRNGKPLPLYLSDGSRVTFNGRIDRIDGDGERVFVTDYKRSAAPSKKDLEQGFDLQLPVYLLAAADLYKAAPTGGTYFVLKNGERASSFVLEDVGNDDLKYKLNKNGLNAGWESFQQFCRQLLVNYIEGIYAGNFAAAPRKACSDFCQLKNICRLAVTPGGREQGGEPKDGKA